jgi:hypothetical protein
MKAKAKPPRVFRGIYLAAEIDSRLRELAARDRRSVTQTTAILLESALKRLDSGEKRETA